MQHINTTTLQTGDRLGFIAGEIQFGEVIIIDEDWVTLKALDSNGFQGKLIKGDHTATVHIADTWIDNH